MNVLVTGGAGLIGMAVRELLAARGHAVTAADINDFGRSDPDLLKLPLDDSRRLGRLLAARAINAIVHCAAISGPMLAKGEPMLVVDANIHATAVVLDAARRHGVARVVNCSSIGVYGNVGRGTITEETAIHPTSIYGASKAAGESLVEGFANEYGVDGVSLRITRVYGPYRRANCYLGDIIRDALAGRETRIACDLGFPYHYVHVDDVAEAILTALLAERLPSRVYLVGSGEAFTMPEVVACARDVIPEARIELVPGVDDVPDLQEVFSLARISQELDWQPRLPLADGLRAYRAAIEAGHAAL